MFPITVGVSTMGLGVYRDCLTTSANVGCRCSEAWDFQKLQGATGPTSARVFFSFFSVIFGALHPTEVFFWLVTSECNKRQILTGHVWNSLHVLTTHPTDCDTKKKKRKKKEKVTNPPFSLYRPTDDKEDLGPRT